MIKTEITFKELSEFLKTHKNDDIPLFDHSVEENKELERKRRNNKRNELIVLTSTGSLLGTSIHSLSGKDTLLCPPSTEDGGEPNGSKN